jgi:hypothetical protein
MMAKLFYASILCVAMVMSGCTSMGVVPETHKVVHRAHEYPIGIVAARFTPDVKMSAALRGKPQGAAEGAFYGLLECGNASAGTGTFAGAAFILCLPIGILLGGTIGAATSESGKNMTTAELTLVERINVTDTQAALAISVSRYLASVDDKNNHEILTDIAGPDHPDNVKVYQSVQAGNIKTLLELGMLGFEFDGSGKEGAIPCLRMKARARKINAQSGQLIDEVDFNRRIACHTSAEWLEDNGRRITEATVQGYKDIAVNIVDELLLIYNTATADSEKNEVPDRGPVPRSVLAPINPPPPDMGINWSHAFSFNKKRGGAQGFGGMRFRDVDTLTPSFAWESFPRPFDQSGAGTQTFSDVVYDLRIYDGALSGLGTISPLHMVNETSGITENHYQLTEPLKPCGWYFWTIRARYRLNGVMRATEWGGAYHTLGGTILPSYARRHGPSLLNPWPAHFLYYPFRTPGDSDKATCWTN